MEGKRLIETIRLENILSYGSETTELKLEPLNVLIGPNASGKSNLIDVFSLLQATPRNIAEPIRQGGGIHEWLWKGHDQLSPASVDVTVNYPWGVMPLRYRLSFRDIRRQFLLWDERIENKEPQPGYEEPFFYYRYQFGDPVLNVVTNPDEPRAERHLKREEVHVGESILSQRRDPFSFPELTYLANLFERIGLYREWNLGPYAPHRRPQKADLPQNSLMEDGSNLGLVLNNLMDLPPIKRKILDRLRAFYPQIEDINTKLTGGSVEVTFHEKGLRHPVPATRLSDGSLRYLCLLVILCHPDPHLVTCIEEPELGLHPDIIPEIADLLIEASSRSQIIVTTHSDVLVDALTSVPEAVIVCEKHDAATQLQRLDRKDLQPWLEHYRLGELWSAGEIGGNRW